MKTKHWTALFLAAAMGAFSPSMNAQPAGAPKSGDTKPGDVRASTNTLVTQIRQKLQSLAGARPTEAAFAKELAQFDKIIADNPGADPNDLAMLLVLKSDLYAGPLGDIDKAADLVRRVKTDYPKTEAAAHAGEMLKQLEQSRAMRAIKDSLQPGKFFPDFSVTDLNGKPLSLSQFKGKVVLVDFWATWCPPCVAEIPNVRAAYGKYRDKGFEIVGISLDRSKADLLKFIGQHKLTWPQYFDGDNPAASLGEKYGIESIPATFLMDADGKIIATNLRGDDLEKHLARLLK